MLMARRCRYPRTESSRHPPGSDLVGLLRVHAVSEPRPVNALLPRSKREPLATPMG
jgi:hypothetical protein